MLRQEQIDRIIALAKEYGATRLILFGSTLENPETARDIDLACDGIEGWDLFAFAAKIENEFLISVDIVPLTPVSRFTQIIERDGKRLI